jgi:hypothetical protein
LFYGSYVNDISSVSQNLRHSCLSVGRRSPYRVRYRNQ